MTEQQLIEGCLKKDRRCQNALYKKYYPLLSSIALRYCSSREDANEQINFSFLKVLQNLKKYQKDRKLSTWIRTIMVHHLIDEYRKSKKHISSVYIELDGESNHGLEMNLIEKKYTEEALRFMLKSLPDVSRTVFNLFAIDGYTHKEIAEMLSISIGTSKWHVSEARTRLKALLLKQEDREKKMIGIGNER
ncbi:MAG: sigma-70 family RNA polymerase sigma factor [Bacteroidia bacterium]